jgi:hypothetical protein
MLVGVDGAGHAAPEFRPLDVFRWELCEVMADEVEDVESLLDATRAELIRMRQVHDLPRAVRVVVRGATHLHSRLLAESLRWTNEIRALADASTWIEKVQFDTRPESDRSALPGDGPLGELLSLLRELREDPQRTQARFADMKDLQDLAKKTWQHTGAALPLADREWLSGLLEEAGSLLTRQLFSRGING